VNSNGPDESQKEERDEIRFGRRSGGEEREEGRSNERVSKLEPRRSVGVHR